MTGLRVVLIAVVVVLAGCSAVADGPAGTAPPEETVTPAPVPTDAPTQGLLAPGLTRDGVVDAELLATAHRRSLRNRSYTERTLTVVTFRGNDTRIGARRFVVEHDDGAFRLRYDLLGGARRAVPAHRTVSADVWSNRSRTVEAVTDGSNTTEYDSFGTTFYAGYTTPDSTLYARVLARNGAHVTDRETRNGTTRYLLRATLPTTPSRFRLHDSSPIDPAVMRAWVTADGRIERVVVRYPAMSRGELATVTHRFEYTDVGNTTVSRPAWFDTAVEHG